MPKAIDFSLQLDDIQAPVSPDGRLLVAAGQSAGKAAEAAGAAKASDKALANQLVSFLGTAAIEGYKGKLESDEEREINDVLRRFSGTAEAEIDANNKKLASQFLDSAASEDFAGAATVRHFTEEARKFAEARRQGVIGREEAVAQIGSVVKKYSAMMPGWASEFRKVAANLTGISNIDIHGIHAMLTQKSAAEKALEKQSEANMQLMKEAASAMGLKSIEDLTPDALAFYRKVKTTALQTDHLNNLKKQHDITQEQADQVNEQLAGAQIANVLAGMQARLTQLHAAQLGADGPLKSEEAVRLGSQVAAEFQLAKGDMIARITRMTIGKNAMSRARADKLIENASKMFDDYSEFVKTADGMNWWKQKVRDAKGNADFLFDRFRFEHPNIMLWKELGVARDYVTAWDALGGNKAEFERRFGKVAADTMELIQKKGMVSYLDAYRRVATGQTRLTDEHDPEHRQMIYNEALLGLQRLAEQGDVLRNNQKDTVSNLANAWLGNVNVTNPADLQKFSRLMVSDKGRQLFEQLDPMQRAKALEPLFTRLGTQVVPDTIKDVKTFTAAVNEGAVNKEWGHKVVITLGIDNRLTAQMVEGNKKPSFGDLPGGAATAPVLARRPNSSNEEREAFRNLQQRLEILNSVPRAMTNLIPLVNSEAKPQLSAMMNQLDVSIKGDKTIDLVGALIAPKGDSDQNDRQLARRVPGNIPPSELVVTPEEQAERDLRAAELRLKETSKEELAKSAEQIRAELKKDISGTARVILKRELDLIEKALSL